MRPPVTYIGQGRGRAMGQQLALGDDLQRTLALRRHGSVLAPLRIVSSQWRHGRLLLFMVALGMLVAVGIASAVPVYVNLAPDALPHMRLISGSLPRDDASPALPDVLMTPQSGLKAGDIVTLGTRDFSARLRYRVSGIWVPRDERDPYWNGRSFRVPEYTVDSGIRNPPPPVFPLLVSPAGFYSSLGVLKPSPGMIVHHVFLTRPTLLNAHNATESIGALARYRASMAYQVTGGNVVTALFTTRASLASLLDAIL